MKFYKSIFLITAIVSIASAVSMGQTVNLIEPEDRASYQKTNSMFFKWSSSPGARYYQIQISTGFDFEEDDILFQYDRVDTTILISGLQNNRSYFWRVRPEKFDWSVPRSFTTTPSARRPVPISPADQSINLDTTAAILWNSNPVNIEYQLQLATNSAFSQNLQVFDVADTAKIVTDLFFDREYFWRVRGKNIDEQYSSYSARQSFTTILPAPTLLFPKDTSTNHPSSIIFEWAQIEDASLYYFQLAENDSFDKPLVDTEVLDPRYSLQELAYNKTYYWRIKVLNQSGQISIWADPFSFSTDTGSPLLLTPPDSSFNVALDSLISWNSVFGADQYTLQISDSNFFDTPILNVELADTSYIADNLRYGKTYFWRTRASASGEFLGEWSDTIFFATDSGIPLLLTPPDSSVNVALDSLFSWTSVLGAEKYTLQISDSNSFDNLTVDVEVVDTNYIADSLLLGEKYFWRTRASASGEFLDGWSDTLMFFTNKGLLVTPDTLRDTLNFSILARDILTPILIENGSNSNLIIDSIKSSIDSIFLIPYDSLEMTPNQIEEFVVQVDTSKLTTDFLSGEILFYQKLNNGFFDSTIVRLEVDFQSAIAASILDTVLIDTTFATKRGLGRFYLRNDGNYSLRIKDVIKEGTDTSSFSFNTSILQSIIKPGDSTLIHIYFEPEGNYEHSTSFNFLTNSYPDSLLKVTAISVGSAGIFSEETLEDFNELKDVIFETFSKNNVPLYIINSGTRPLNLWFNFVEDYFELSNLEENNYQLNVDDTLGLFINYLSPNFELENIDSLKIWHNSYMESPIVIPLHATFDSTNAASVIQTNLKINGSDFEEKDYIFPEKTSIQFHFNEEILEDSENLHFRLVYFLGGPGNKISASEGGEGKQIIPFGKVNDRGLLFAGELLTVNSLGTVMDSVYVSEFLDGQVVVEKYETVPINVPRSNPVENNTNTKWVLFGFPHGDVIVDSVFSYFGGREMMNDGEWIVYNYNSQNRNNFSEVNNFYFEPLKGYFVAQSLINDFELKYTYSNSFKSRKLSEHILPVDGEGWRVISSPYTFDVEIDTSAILYKYDPNVNAYRLTSIMRPGEAYFVAPEVQNLKLKTFGEYYPDLFPKILANGEWAIKLHIKSERKTEELIFCATQDDSQSEVSLKTAPKLDNKFHAAIVSDSENVFSRKKDNGGIVWEFQVKSGDDDVHYEFKSEYIGKFKNNYESVIVNAVTGEKYSAEISLSKNLKNNYLLIAGEKEFIQQKISNIFSIVPTSYNLEQNFPNPFNPNTIIKYQLPETGYVKLKIYDLLGREVTTLVNAEQKAGTYSINFNAEKLSSGIYFYNITTEKFTKTRKMMFLK